MPDIELQIHTEDDQVHRIDSPDDLQVREIVKDLITVFVLPAGLPWSLYAKRIARTLDPERTLQENGVTGGEELFLSSKPTPNHRPLVCKACGSSSVAGSKICEACGKPFDNHARESREIRLHLFTPSGQKHSLWVDWKISVND